MNFFSRAKDKLTQLSNHFFYEDEPQEPQEDMEEPMQQAYQPPMQQAYQQPVQQTYQQPMQQQPIYSQFSTQFNPQPQGQRNRRAEQRAQRQETENVLPFPGDYQGQQTQSAQQAPAAPVPQQSTFNSRVIAIRGIDDCRRAISLLRDGDLLVVVMEGVTDPEEMRRYVDTLSGACFSLSASITKVSRHGTYVIAPQTVTVYMDQATSQMNGVRPAQPQRVPQRPNMYQPYQRPYQPMNYQQSQPMNYQQPMYQPMPQTDANGFEQRMPAGDVPQNNFYQRPAQQVPVQVPFETQAPSTGYAPDRKEAAAE